MGSVFVLVVFFFFLMTETDVSCTEMPPKASKEELKARMEELNK